MSRDQLALNIQPARQPQVIRHQASTLYTQHRQKRTSNDIVQTTQLTTTRLNFNTQPCF